MSLTRPTSYAPPKRILISTKFRFIGDTLLAIPALRAARASWPDAHIALLTGRKAAQLLQNNPLLDQLIEFEPTGADQGLSKFFSVVKTLRRGKFDMSFCLNRSFHSALIPCLAGIPIRAGWTSEGRTFLLNRSIAYDNSKPEISCYFDILRLIDPNVVDDSRVELWVSETEHQLADKMLKERFHVGAQNRRLLGIQPGASLEIKRWPVDRFASVASEILTTHPDVWIVICGGPDEVTVANEMMDRMADEARSRTLNVAGLTDLRGSIALLSRLDLFLGNDTAVLHCAAAVGVPTLALFGPTNARKWGNASTRNVVLTAPTERMEEHQVTSVTTTLSSLLDEQGRTD